MLRISQSNGLSCGFKTGYQNPQMPESHPTERRDSVWKTTGRERLRNTVPGLNVRTIFLTASFHGHLQSTVLTTNAHLISRNTAVEETPWVLKPLWLQGPHYILHFINQGFSCCCSHYIHWKPVPEQASLMTGNCLLISRLNVFIATFRPFVLKPDFV